MSYIRRGDEMERRLEYFEKQLAKFGLQIEDNGEIEDYLATIRADKAITSEEVLTSLENLLEQNENTLKELERNNVQLTSQYNQKVEQKFVLEHGNKFFRDENVAVSAEALKEEEKASQMGRSDCRC